MLFDFKMPGLVLLCVFVVGVVFLSGVHRRTVPLLLLLLISALVALGVPAISSILGPGPALDAAGQVMRGTDGLPLYPFAALLSYSTAMGEVAALTALSCVLFVVSSFFLILRQIKQYREKRDSI